MKQPLFTIPVLLFVTITSFSCHTAYQSQALEYQTYRITDQQQKDSALLHFLQPYSKEVNATMNDVVGIAATGLDKKQPESTLGNFMVDAFFTMAKEKYNVSIDGALLNYGGIRMQQLPAGNVTTGKIFQIMPFDNLLILQKVKGSLLQELLDLIASEGGWPIAGITMQIKNNKAINVLIGSKPIDFERVYTIANSDFVANGGNRAYMLKNIPQISNGYLMRDALFDYIKLLNQKGENINSKIENRITIIE